MTTELQRMTETINSNLDSLKDMTDEEFEEIKRGIKGRFDEDVEAVLIAMIEQKRSEFKTRN